MEAYIKRCPRGEQENHGEYAYRFLRSCVMSFRLKPGDLINEAELSQLLNISRTPVHEAILRLRSEGLVDVIPRRESKVSRIDISLVNEGVFLRSCVEPKVMMLARGNLPPSAIKALLENLQKQRSLIDNMAVGEFNQIDDEFHRIIYRAIGKESIFTHLRTAYTHLDRIRELIRIECSLESMEVSLSEHLRLFEYAAFNAMPDGGIERHVNAHIIRYQDNMSALISAYPDYFSFEERKSP